MSGNSIAARLGKQSTFYFAGNVFTFLAGFPLQIFVARAIGASGLGTYGLIEAGVSILKGLLGFGLAGALVRFVPSLLAEGDFNCIRRLIRKGSFLLCGIGAVAYVLAAACTPWVVRIWPGLSGSEIVIYVMLLMIPVGLLYAFFQQGLRGFQDIRYIVIGSSFLQLTVKAILAIVLLTYGFSLLGYVWAVSLSTVFGMLWMGYGLKKKVAILPAAHGVNYQATWVRFRSYAITIYGASIVGLCTMNIDRFLLGYLSGVATVGVYSVVIQLYGMTLVFSQMFLSIAGPMLAEAHSADDKRRRHQIYALTTDWSVRLSMPFLLFLFIFAEPVLALYGPEFSESGLFSLRLLIVSQMLNFIMGPIGAVLLMGDKEGFLLKLSIFGMLFKLLGFYLLILLLGLLGAAVTLALWSFFEKLTSLYMARRHMEFQWSDARYLQWWAPIASCALLGFCINYYNSEKSVALLVLAISIQVLAFHAVSLLRGLNSDDLELLRSLPIVGILCRDKGAR